jgi:hypothetical protein
VLKQLDLIPTHSARETRLHSFSAVGPHSSVTTNEANIGAVPPPGRLYSVAQITFAAWAASPLAGCLLLSFNYRALQNRRAGWLALVLGFLVTVLVFTFTLLFPHKLPRMTLPLASAAAMWPVASYLQGHATTNHFAAGGKKGWWTTVGLSVGLILCIFVVLLLALCFTTTSAVIISAGDSPCGPTNRWTRAAGTYFA